MLANFRQGGAWDAQHIGGKQHREYRDYSTIAIGLYAAAAGISESEILRVQDIYAWMHSRFPSNTGFDETYTHLPKRNVEDTLAGYLLYQSGDARTDRK